MNVLPARRLLPGSVSLVFVLGALYASPARAADVASLQARARERGLAHRIEWLRLLHMDPRFPSGFESRVKPGPFFVAPTGATDPQAELDATIALLWGTPGGEGEAVRRCRYPARLITLLSLLELGPADVPDLACEAFTRYLLQLAPASVSVVFSGYFLSSPASTFGHTLLRINKVDDPTQRTELLDMGINYAAVVDTQNSLVYAFKGLTGLFDATATAVPFYYKVREYNDYESRDLWEYDLALDPRSMLLLASHLWELGDARFRYYYATQNCSYLVATTLEAVLPGLSLVDRGKPVVVPADTVRALAAVPGLVRRVRYRPSLRNVVEARTAGMSGDQLALVDALVAAPSAPLPAALGEGETQALLDAALDLFDVRFASQVLLEQGNEANRQRRVLLERRSAQGRPVVPVVVRTPAHEQPETGHGSHRLDFATGWSARHPGGELRLGGRLVMHDLVDPSQGYPAFGRIELLAGQLRVPVDGTLPTLDHFWLFRVGSFQPLSPLFLGASWAVQAGVRTLRDAGCSGCLVANVAYETGLTLATAGRQLALVALVGANVDSGPGLQGIERWPVRAGPTGSLLVRWHPVPAFVGVVRLGGAWFPWTLSRFELSLDATATLSITESLALRLGAGVGLLGTEASAGLAWFL